jgi:hypothetical protein
LYGQNSFLKPDAKKFCMAEKWHFWPVPPPLLILLGNKKARRSELD